MRVCQGSFPVRVGDVEFGKYISLSGFHAFSIGVAAVVEACEMQDAVHHKVRRMLKHRFVLG